MNIRLIAVGKTDKDYVEQGAEEFFKRVKRYNSFDFHIVKDLKNTKNLDPKTQKNLEGNNILQNISTTDFVIILDENGKHYSSREFASFIEKHMSLSTKNLVFVIGGALGFSQSVYERANIKISLSTMTFSHQLIRLIFAEQLYRAFSIINNEPYHND